MLQLKKKKLDKKKQKYRLFFLIINLFSKKKFLHSIFLKFNNRGGDRFLVKWSYFAFLVCAFHKEPIVASDFDRLHLKNYFEFVQAV